MKTLRRLISTELLVAHVVCLLIAGCGTTPVTISAQPKGLIETAVSGNAGIVASAKAGALNLDTAIKDTVLPAADPFDACWHAGMQAAGIEPIPGAPATTALSFSCTRATELERLSCAYIELQQAKAAAATPFTVSPACLQVWGQIKLDELKATADPVGTVKSLLGIPSLK